MQGKFILLLLIGSLGWTLNAQVTDQAERPGFSKQVPGRFWSSGFDFSPDQGIQTRTVAMAFPYAKARHFIAFTLRCSGVSTAGNFEVRYALRDYEQTLWMSEWVELEDDPHVSLPSGERQFGMFFFPPDAWFMELRANDLETAVSTEYFFYSPIDYAQTDPGPQPFTGGVQDRACPCAVPDFVNRAGWDGPASQQPGCTPQYTDVTHVFIHHQAGVATPPYGAVVKAIWQQHVFTNNWCDIGYNWLIAPDGTVYEGRAGGNNVIGAHVTGHNSNSMGVCLLGNYQNDGPTPAARESLRRLLAWKCCDSGINPAGVSIHAGMSLHTISGHRDADATLCPGDNLYTVLPAVRSSTDSLYRDPTGCDGLWAPGNDDCDDAEVLFSSETCVPVEGTTDDATASGVPIPTCNGFTSETALDVWYRFGVTEDHHRVTVTPTGNLPDPLDAVVAVYDGSCANLQLVTCVDVPGGPGVPTTVDLPDLIPGHIYYIRVYDYGSVPAGDGRFEICLQHGAAVSTQAPGLSDGVKIFPNPTVGSTTVLLPAQSALPVTLRVLDLTGRLVHAQTTSGREVRLDLSGNPSGIYLVDIRTSSGSIRKRLVLR